MGDGRHGIARYILSMAPYLGASPDAAWTAVCPPEWEAVLRAAGMRTIASTLPFTSPLAPFALARLQREVKPDVTFAPSFVPALPSRGPLVMTIHDATHLLRPGDFSPLVRAYYRAVTLPAARRGRVITVSEFSRRQLEAHGGLRDISVIPNGVDHQVFTVSGAADERIGERTVLYVGGYKPHKRVPLLIDALARIPEVRLALVGTPPDALLMEARARLGDRLLLLGRLTDEGLAAAYRAATLLVYPSELEGFGLPPLEAMACGTPVIAADGSSLPEVVGDAGLLVRGGAEEFVGAIRGVLGDAAVRSRMRDAGIARAATFSFERTATETERVLREAA